MSSPEITIDISVLPLYAKPAALYPLLEPPLVPQDSGIRSTTPKAKVSFGLVICQKKFAKGMGMDDMSESM